jgi:biotin transport system substrate-specific component
MGIFAAIIAVCAQLSFPMPYGVPMSLQTFAIPLAGIVLGAKKGVLSTLVYVLLGAIGIPVFAGFTGGLGIVIGPTGGFILSFPFMALSAGIGEAKNSKTWLLLWLALGTVINYLCGMYVFSLVMSSGIKTAFAVCVLPFILPDIVKIVLVAVWGRMIKQMLIKSKVL